MSGFQPSGKSSLGPSTCWGQSEVTSLTALAGEVSVEGSKSDQAIMVGGGWAGMSAATTVLENGGSVVSLDKYSRGSNSRRDERSLESVN